MLGFYNSVLRIDAGRMSYDTFSVPEQVLRTRLGGKGLATHILLQDNPPRVDPLSPENLLIFAIGPAVGTDLWGSCRHGVYTKSPLTGLYSESYAGGSIAQRIAEAGVDAFIIQGASQQPIWIEICSEGVFFHSAEDLWGRETYQTEDLIKSWLRVNRPQARAPGVVTIGPAGENLVAFSVIENDYWRSAGRTGVGAVMGSKKIKAIAVWGSMKKNLAHHDLARHFASDFIKKYKDHAATKAFKTMGTPMMVDILNHVGAFPSRYWQQGKVPHVDMINAAALHERCKVVPSACLKCFMACGRRSTVLQGRHTGLTLEGPEYETIYVFGGLCLVNSIEEIVYLNDLCDRLGLDTITAGNLVAFTIEATLRGRSDAKISYGDVDAIAALIHDIAYRRGTGQILAHGIREAAAEWGLEELAIHVKGMEPAGYDPRILKGMALAYGTSDRGACHLRSTFYKLELSGMFDPEQIEGKAAVFADWEDRHILLDTFIFCRFYRDFYLWDEMSAVVKATMGLDLDEGELRACARAVANDTRLFNLREGLKPEDDKLPRRFYAESLPETGKIISEQQMEIMLREYYQARGWDEQGRPKAE